MKRFDKILFTLFPILMLTLAIWSIIHEFRAYSPDDLWHSLQNISKSRKLGAIALTGLGYLAITGYDLLGFFYIRHNLARNKIIFTSFLSYAIGNTVGFTLFSGTAIRYRFYKAAGVSSVKIAKVIAFTHLSFWLGMLAIGGVVFLVEPLTLPDMLKLPFDSVRTLGWLFLAITGCYLALAWYQKPLKIRGETIELPSVNLSLGLIIVSALDWAIASGVLYLLIPAHTYVSYPVFFGIYVLALTAGIISTVPGGLGIFETVILWLRPPSLSAADMLGALLAYRVIYYFIPFIVAAILWGVYEWKRQRIT